jgi:hypothetical protein
VRVGHLIPVSLSRQAKSFVLLATGHFVFDLRVYLCRKYCWQMVSDALVSQVHAMVGLLLAVPAIRSLEIWSRLLADPDLTPAMVDEFWFRTTLWTWLSVGWSSLYFSYEIVLELYRTVSALAHRKWPRVDNLLHATLCFLVYAVLGGGYGMAHPLLCASLVQEVSTLAYNASKFLAARLKRLKLIHQIRKRLSSDLSRMYPSEPFGSSTTTEPATAPPATAPTTPQAEKSDDLKQPKCAPTSQTAANATGAAPGTADRTATALASDRSAVDGSLAKASGARRRVRFAKPVKSVQYGCEKDAGDARLVKSGDDGDDEDDEEDADEEEEEIARLEMSLQQLRTLFMVMFFLVRLAFFGLSVIAWAFPFIRAGWDLQAPLLASSRQQWPPRVDTDSVPLYPARVAAVAFAASMFLNCIWFVAMLVLAARRTKSAHARPNQDRLTAPSADQSVSSGPNTTTTTTTTTTTSDLARVLPASTVATHTSKLEPVERGDDNTPCVPKLVAREAGGQPWPTTKDDARRMLAGDRAFLRKTMNSAPYLMTELIVSLKCLP